MTPHMRPFPYEVLPTTYEVVPTKYEVVPNHLWGRFHHSLCTFMRCFNPDQIWGRSHLLWGNFLNCSIFSHRFLYFITWTVPHQISIMISQIYEYCLHVCRRYFLHLCRRIWLFTFVDEIVCTCVDGIFAHLSILTRLPVVKVICCYLCSHHTRQTCACDVKLFTSIVP